MDRRGLEREITAFKTAKNIETARARQLAALQLACHVDLDEALNGESDQRMRLAVRLERLIERERQRGMRKHWSYDLNRHIALKQALDRLKRETSPGVPPAMPKTKSRRRSAKRTTPK